MPEHPGPERPLLGPRTLRFATCPGVSPRKRTFGEARWFLPVTGELRLGGKYQLEGNAGGTVTDCDPPRSFAVTWELMGFVSWVAVSLSADGPDRTAVTLAHTVDTDNDHWRQFGPAAVGIGWDLAWVRGLQPYLHGEAPDAAAEAMWPLSAEGRAFVHACADSWAEANAEG